MSGRGNAVWHEMIILIEVCGPEWFQSASTAAICEVSPVRSNPVWLGDRFFLVPEALLV